MENKAKMASNEKPGSVLGDIYPASEGSAAGHRVVRPGPAETTEPEPDRAENEESMGGGSRHDRAQHSGSREVTEGPSGGVGTETGGTRNYRSGSGATGGDLGNRPE